MIGNAGFGALGDFIQDDPELLRQEIAVEISATVQISVASLPDMVKAGEGFVINIASMAACTPPAGGRPRSWEHSC